MSSNKDNDTNHDEGTEQAEPEATEAVPEPPPQEAQPPEVSAASEEAPANDDVEQRAPTGPLERAGAKPLALKMARVMSQVSQVPMNGRNDFHGYDYIMESDLVDQLRGKLAEQGVAIFPSIREHTVTPIKDGRGRTQYMATVTLEVTFIDGDSGDQMTTTWVGQGVDSGDKGYYKAYTGAFKYALLKTFLISGEEGRGEVRAPRSSRGKRRAKGRR